MAHPQINSHRNPCRGCAHMRRIVGLRRRGTEPDGLEHPTLFRLFPNGLTMRLRAFHLSMAVLLLALSLAIIWAGAKGVSWTAGEIINRLLG